MSASHPMQARPATTSIVAAMVTLRGARQMSIVIQLVFPRASGTRGAPRVGAECAFFPIEWVCALRWVDARLTTGALQYDIAPILLVHLPTHSESIRNSLHEF